MTNAAEEFKDRQKMVWSLGNYSVIAEMIEPAAHRLLDECDVGPGTSLLDVGAGTGNVALEAARRGAAVIASDLTPHLIEIGKARAEAEGLDVEWREADAEALPFADDSFDVVTSVFGAMFAPHAARVATEMVRVAKPGGLVAFATWDANGYTGQMFASGSKYQPPLAEGIDAPLTWGEEATARARFEATGARVEIVRDSVLWHFESPERHKEIMVQNAPPMVAAKMALPEETFEEMMREYEELQARFNRGEGGEVAIDSDYFIVLARKAG